MTLHDLLDPIFDPIFDPTDETAPGEAPSGAWEPIDLTGGEGGGE